MVNDFDIPPPGKVFPSKDILAINPPKKSRAVGESYPAKWAEALWVCYWSMTIIDINK